MARETEIAPEQFGIVRPGSAFPFPSPTEAQGIELSDIELHKVVGGQLASPNPAAPFPSTGTIMCAW
jgi:hypothetical protein